MPKVVSAILSGPIGLIDRRAGQIVSGIALTAIGVATGNALLISLGSFQLSQGFAPTLPKPETTSGALKTERPPRVSAYGRVKLFWAYALFTNNTKGVAVDVGAFHEGRIDAIEGWYLGDKKVTRLPSGYVSKGADKAYGDNKIAIGANLGAATETSHAAVMAALPGIWTANHRGDGVVSGYMISQPVKAKDFQTVYPSGGPNQTPLAIVIRAQLVFDWRDPAQSVTDPLTWKWSENWVLHIAHYQLVRNGKTWSRHFEPTLDYWTAAADDADVLMTTPEGTEPRYRSCVSHRHAGDGSEHKAVLGALLACGDGWMTPRADGALVVYSGRYYEPTVFVGPDIVTAYTVEDGVEDEKALNQIGVTYVSSDHDYNTIDTDPWIDEADILARGQVRAGELANQVPSRFQARRLARRKMIQTMASKRGTFTTLAAGRDILSERFIDLLLAEGVGSDDEFIAYEGPAEIVGLSRNLQTGAVTASWIAADPSIDEDEDVEAGSPPASEPNEREPLEQPVIAAAEADFEADASAGFPGAFLRLTVDGPDREDVQWFARTRVVGAAVWGERSYPDIETGASVTINTEFVPTDAEIEVQVQYQVADGRYSEWSDSVVVDTTTEDIELIIDGGF